jgi:hypothetical protein
VCVLDVHRLIDLLQVFEIFAQARVSTVRALIDLPTLATVCGVWCVALSARVHTTASDARAA